MQKLTYVVARRRRTGTVLSPHRCEDGSYRAHRTNSRNDPAGKRVKTMEELVELVRMGYHVCMRTLRPDMHRRR